MAGGAYPVPPGPSITEQIWDEMDHQLGKLMSLKEEGWAPGDKQLAAQTGHCLGIAKCLAIFMNPYDPDVDAIRAEAMRRWEARRA